MSASSQQHKSQVRTTLHMAGKCSPQWPRTEIATAGAMLCWHAPSAFGYVCFGAWAAACYELPGPPPPASILPGRRICCSPRLRGLVSAGARSGPRQGCRGVKRDRPIHSLSSAPWELPLPQDMAHEPHFTTTNTIMLWNWNWKRWAWSWGWCSCSSHSSLGQGLRGLVVRRGTCLFALASTTSGATAAKDYADQ